MQEPDVPVCGVFPRLQLLIVVAGQFGWPAPTFTVALCIPVDTPAPFQHSSEYVVVTIGFTTKLFEPLNAFQPLHPPDAQHEVAPTGSHIRVEGLPEVIDVGEAPKVRVGPPQAGVLADTLEEYAELPAEFSARRL